MNYDVREYHAESIKRIVFGYGEFIELTTALGGRIAVEDADGDIAFIKKDSVDNLIKALEKAKELGWCS